MKYEVFTNTDKMKIKMVSRKTAITLTMMLVCIFSFAQVKKKALPLDGKTFTVDFYQEGKDKKWNSDDIKFMMGSKLKPSGIFGDWGFTSATPYTCTTMDSLAEKKIYQFECESKPNDKGEILIWSGTVTGDDIEGTVERQKKGKTQKSFTFTGSIKEKKAPGPKPK